MHRNLHDRMKAMRADRLSSLLCRVSSARRSSPKRAIAVARLLKLGFDRHTAQQKGIGNDNERRLAAMNKGATMRHWLLAISLTILGGGMSAEAGLFGFGGDSWKEEVLLHDGQKIIVERSQTYGGRHEIGQSQPIKEHTISFTLPQSKKPITWTSEYSKDIGRTNFNLLAVHVMNGTPYLVASPNLCLSYNKWGRPNPPYVFFKYDAKAWQRIPLSEFPAEFKTINVALDIRGREVEELTRIGLVPAEKIKALNAYTEIPEYKTILREALSREKCPQYPSGPKAPFPITPAPPK